MYGAIKPAISSATLESLKERIWIHRSRKATLGLPAPPPPPPQYIELRQPDAAAENANGCLAWAFKQVESYFRSLSMGGISVVITNPFKISGRLGAVIWSHLCSHDAI